MKKVLLTYLVSAILLGVLFFIVLLRFDNGTITDCAFWFGIVLLLLAFFTKKDSSVMPFGGLKGFGTKNNGMDMTLGNEIILTRGELHRKKIENEYNNKNDGSDLSLMFFVFGVIFFGISLVSVWVL